MMEGDWGARGEHPNLSLVTHEREEKGTYSVAGLTGEYQVKMQTGGKQHHGVCVRQGPHPHTLCPSKARPESS